MPIDTQRIIVDAAPKRRHVFMPFADAMLRCYSADYAAERR